MGGNLAPWVGLKLAAVGISRTVSPPPHSLELGALGRTGSHQAISDVSFVSESYLRLGGGNLKHAGFGS